MEQRRAGSKRAFVVAWLLTLGLALAVGPFGSPAETDECGSGASCAPSKLHAQANQETHGSDWRGRKPEICLTSACDVRRPTFCAVAVRAPMVKDRLHLRPERDPCRVERRFRTAEARG